jgi:hypothetical protein
MELKKGNLKAELEWEIEAQISRSGDVATIAKGDSSVPMTVRGRMYADPACLGKGVYLLVGAADDINGVVNAADSAHIPTVSGTPFAKMQTLSLGEDGYYKMYAMLCYANRTADAKEYYENHPEERVYIGAVKHQGQTGPVIPPIPTGGIWEAIVNAYKAVGARVPEWGPKVLATGLIVGGGYGVYQMQYGTEGRGRGGQGRRL